MNEFIEVTRLLDAEKNAREEELFEAFREAFAVATSDPRVRTMRACVATYDEYYAAVSEGAKSGAHTQHKT